MPRRLHGMEAIEHAREHSLTLCKYHTFMEEHRRGLSVEEAEELAREEPSLIYLDVELYPGEREISNMITKYRIERRGNQLAIFPGRGKFTEDEKKLLGEMKPKILAELLRREKEFVEKQAAEEAARVEEARAIRAGEVMIVPNVEDYDGIPLYLVFGEAAKALKEIGAAKYINGWGYCVEGAIIKVLGKEFTFPQVEEFLRPSREAQEAKEQAVEEERQAKFAEARRTGERVELRSWMADCNDPREECSLDHVTEYAMPDGTTKIERQHTW